MVTQAPSTESEPASTAVISPGRKFKIAGERVRASVRELPANQRDDVFWFYNFLVRLDPDKQTLGKILRKPGGAGYYSDSSIIHLLTGGRGNRGESTEVIHSAIVALRKIEEPREEQAESGFIETRLFKVIEDRALKALRRQRIAWVFGDSQIGKSAALKEIRRRHNHGTTIYVEVPSGGSLGKFLVALAEALNIRVKGRMRDIEQAILSAIDSTNLLLIDEAHRFFEGREKSAGMSAFSFIRLLWNKCQCGMLLAMTNEGRDELLTGRHAKSLQQLWRRRITPLQLPAFPPDDDAALFAHAFGLPDAPDEPVSVNLTVWDDRGREQKVTHTDNPLRLQREQLRKEGLGVWIGILEDASDMARDSKRAITWAAVLKAHAQAQADAEIYK